MAILYDSFYVPPPLIENELIRFPDKEAHHIIHVLRKKIGDIITITDGRGNAYECNITSAEHKTLHAKIIRRLQENNEPELSLTLAVSLPKKDKFELIIEKCTELGVTKFIPLISERTQTKAKSINAERCKKIAISAMKQCQRSFLPVLEEPVKLHELFEKDAYDLKIVAHEKISGTNISDVILHRKKTLKAVLAVGPEGGFSADEITSFTQNGYIPVSLGKRRLRTETAAIKASALLIDGLEFKH